MRTDCLTLCFFEEGVRDRSAMFNILYCVISYQMGRLIFEELHVPDHT